MFVLFQTELEITCSLSHEYPRAAPDVFIRCAQLSRLEHKRLYDKLTLHVAELERGEICLGSVIQWLQDKAGGYIEASRIDTPLPKPLETHGPGKVNMYCRMWIYSHHITLGGYLIGSFDNLCAEFPNISRLQRRDKYHFWHL